MQKQRININGYDDIKTRAHNVQFISVVLILCKKKNVNDCLFAMLSDTGVSKAKNIVY